VGKKGQCILIVEDVLNIIGNNVSIFNSRSCGICNADLLMSLLIAEFDNCEVTGKEYWHLLD